MTETKTENRYEEQFQKLKAYSEEEHKNNQHKIKVGIWVNIFLPLFFLILSFINTDSKIVFLIFWIISLFAIAFYLMTVEYQDYSLQERMREFGVVEEDERDFLFGHAVSSVTDKAMDKADVINEKLTETKKTISNTITKVLGSDTNKEDKDQ